MTNLDQTDASSADSVQLVLLFRLNVPQTERAGDAVV